MVCEIFSDGFESLTNLFCYRILFCTATLQFILSTIYVAFALRLLIEGFIWAVDTPEGTLGYWINPSIRAQVGSKAVYITNASVDR
jgi:hypothetical protein